MSRLLLALLLLLTPTLAHAQVTGPPFTFANDTVADADEVNANFAALFTGAVSRTAGVMLGHLTFGTDNLYDIGASGATRPRDLFLSRNLTLGGAFVCTGCVAAAQLTDTAVTPGTYGGTGFVPVVTVDADGRVTAASNIASNLFGGIEEAGITNGAILARVGENETITGNWSINGAWSFNSTPTFPNIQHVGVAPQTIWYESDAAADAKYWRVLAESGVWQLNTVNDAFSSAGSAPIYVQRSGNTTTGVTLAGTNIGLSGNVTVNGALATTGAATLASASVTGALTVGGTLTAGTFSPTVLRAGSGSSSAVAYGFSLDAATGMYRDNPELRFAVGGINILRLGEDTGTSYIQNTLNTRALTPNSNLSFNIGSAGARYTTVFAGTVDTTSDMRFKRDILPLTVGLPFIKALRPVSYYRTDGGPLRYGFTAQDLLGVGFPGVSTENPTSYGVNYDDLIAPLVKAVQELEARLAVLEGRGRRE